jgi:CheY-like chemotaxis protein
MAADAEQHVAVQPGSYVMLAVSDTGSGIEPETMKHIFEPFFTTKDQGKGTGLGLSTVYGIVKQSGGNIWFYSEPGHGTVFKIFLPRVVNAQQPLSPDSDAEYPIAKGGTETILVVEDEPQIRQMACEVLSECGYKLLVAANGVEALRILKEESAAIDLILTDVVMPEMNGRELAEHVAVARPAAKVLYMSGYTNDAIVRHGVLDSGTWFVQKPFSPDALARKIREVLDSGNLSTEMETPASLGATE